MDDDSGPDDSNLVLLPLADSLELAGLNRRTLLSWERRHGVLPSYRDGSGRRFYSRENVRRLTALRAATEAGYRIGDLADKGIVELEAMIGPGSEGNEAADALTEQLIASAVALDIERVDAHLRIMLRQDGLEKFVSDRVMSLLVTVGDRWADQKLHVPSEHLVSTALKRILLDALLDIGVNAGAPTMVSTTLPGEEHVFGALAAAILARMRGVDATYFGGNLPPSDIAAAVLRLNARLVAISCINGNPAGVAASLEVLRNALPDDTMLVVGGSMAPAALPGVRRIESFAHFVLLCDALVNPEDSRTKFP